jgi:hypothetical protein
MFRKFEHMCYLNVQNTNYNWECILIIYNSYENLKKWFSFKLKVAQSKYKMVIDLGFWKTHYLIILPM